MDRNLYANLNQGIDSFLRVAMTLRRKEIAIKAISMTTDKYENTGIKLTINEDKTSLQEVINYMNKLYDVKDLKVQ
ncbi:MULTISPECIES: ACT domain-containing protein [unclassified Romboutsia]|uniref:ACT domain-containing protein n=1 Tax=unclassified Romboutsia TaxID=2626894 RepID=UPI000821227F|nr:MULTISPECIES: ACT domain-containing protein [unclassified Romboutsia]SCH72866.1 Uncharacterised protein [uncultured Clostridium sp.]